MNKSTKSKKKSPKSYKKPIKRAAATASQNLKLKLAPHGPDQSSIEALSRELLQHTSLRAHLQKTRTRLLSVELLESEAKIKTSRPLPPPDKFRATIYDYSNNRMIQATGGLTNRRRLEVEEFSRQPLPSPEEFEEAVKILTKEAGIGAALREEHLKPYRPMPPLIEAEQPDGRVERTIAVGLLPMNKEARHEIVGVNMIRQTVVRFENRAPENAAAHNPICGLPDAGQATAGKGTAGQVWVTVSQGGTVVWKFLVVRPAASSGTNGSGVELRYVDYRGKRVLYRAHVPILNVKYDGDACGPYRDWQYQEGMIQANGTNVGSGFRLSSSPAQTILDTGSDTGNFLGTAIYVQGQEVVLVSEMEAGWYRYISQWRLHTNGTIRPRFGFSAVSSSCVCTTHHHHVYWRFDFDIRTIGNNIVREFNNPCLPGICPSNWHNKDFEIRRSRDYSRNRKWRVQNSVTGEAYDVIPGPDDGVATAAPDWPFGRGDVWILRYHGSEIDDGVVATGPPYEALLNAFINGESIKNRDVVIWYGAHFTHDVAAEPPGSHGHIVGPDLKPVNW
jgi:hypothetical protein